jgi:hypothetical protein
MSPIGNLEGYSYILVMKMPRPIDLFLNYSRGKHDTMKNNSRFASLTLQIAALDEANIALTTSQAGYKAKPQTVTKATRDADDKAARTALKVLASSVQTMATADSANAEKIITDAGFDVKIIPIKQKQKNTVIDGPESGSVIIFGEGGGPHNFRQSIDGVTWTNLIGSKDSRKNQRGLIVGKLYYFQTMKALKGGEEGEWSQTLSIVVR